MGRREIKPDHFSFLMISHFSFYRNRDMFLAGQEGVIFISIGRTVD
jgi:hypothetical protein